MDLPAEAVQHQPTTVAPALSPLEVVSQSTASAIRVFLTEVAEGTSNYRSLHRLTRQVEHQYAGRFLIELVQNAHDALEDPDCGRDEGRISVVLDLNDSEHGALLVANDGRPFSRSNFESLSQLGQSDKDPEKSIGNKGVGFRSVLEISDCPEVYSRARQRSAGFDGFSFAFVPKLVDELLGPMLALAEDGPVPASPLVPGQLIDWTQDTRAKFRSRIRALGRGGLVQELNKLSPYNLPKPLAAVTSQAVRLLEREGFSTVIRLPLRSPRMQDYVRTKLADFTARTALFLPKLKSLSLTVAGERSTRIERTVAPWPEANGYRVELNENAGVPSTYGVWSRDVQLQSAPTAVREALDRLPDPWPTINHVSVEIAVKLGDAPEAGTLSIFLPTALSSGSAVHIQAPFYGDISRTHIDFNDRYNLFLLETATDLALDVVRRCLAGKGETEARAIIDILAPFGDDVEAGKTWYERMRQANDRAGAAFPEEPLALANSGWHPLNATSLVPDYAGTTVLTKDALRRHAQFEVFHPCLDSREDQLIRLASLCFSEVGAYPLESDMAATVAAVAKDGAPDALDWNAFWRDVALVLPKGHSELGKHEVLIGTDGVLHSASGECTVFFVPRQGALDSDEIDSEGGTTDVPESLRSFVAFLRDDLELYQTLPPPANRVVRTPLRRYLEGGLVETFRVESIFTEVLNRRTPQLPVALRSPSRRLCVDILGWALRLVDSLYRRGRGSDRAARLLRGIPVPCVGGWYPLEESSFGPGWEGTSGATLWAYLGAMTTPSATEARKRLLLPPNSPEWRGGPTPPVERLKAAGVVDGLRLFEIKPDSWAADLQATNVWCRLPDKGPSAIPGEQWHRYKAAVDDTVAPPFSSWHTYGVGPLFIVPGFGEIESAPEEARIAFSDLVLTSIGQWTRALQPVSLTKRGGHPNVLMLRSPLRWLLETAPWLAVNERDGKLRWSSTGERWHVPAHHLSGRTIHFAHLDPLHSKLARRLDGDPTLATSLYDLGLPLFDIERGSADQRLLYRLIEAIGSPKVSDPNVLLSQLRDAWSVFVPEHDSPPIPQLPVRQSGGKLQGIAPTSTAPAFLPDSATLASTLEAFGKPVIAIHVNDAKRLRKWFERAYGDSVVAASKLSLVPKTGELAWSKDRAMPLTESSLGWLMGPVLTMVAFHRQPLSLHAEAFKQRLLLMQEMNVDWVPSLAVELQKDGQVLLSTPVDAFWHSATKTLIGTERSRLRPALLCSSLSQALDRDDLSLPLRVLLSRVESADVEPTDPVSLLAEVEISAEQAYQVQEHLRGDVTQAARLLEVLAVALSVEHDAEAIRTAQSEDELRQAVLAHHELAEYASSAIQSAHECRDFFSFGKAMAARLHVDLPRWNGALELCGYRPVSNRDWQAELRAQLAEAAPLLRRLLAHQERMLASEAFSVRWQEYETLHASIDLGMRHWEVGFEDAMKAASPVIERWGCTTELVIELASAQSVDDLRTAMVSNGVDLSFSPDECFRRNKDSFDAVVDRLEELRLAWAVRTQPDVPVAAEVRLAVASSSVAMESLARHGYVNEWAERDVLTMVRSAFVADATDAFWAAVETCEDLSAVQQALGLSDDDVGRAEERLAQRKAEAQKKQKLVKVCGVDFDSSPDNLQALWSFLGTHVPDASLQAASASTSLNAPADLAAVRPSGHNKSGKATQPPPGRPPRQSKQLEDLTGYAGEIYAFRVLQMRHGPDVVTPTAWVSGNSRYAYPGNGGDDFAGYDITFTEKGITYYVEVKASAGEDDSFTMGSSEIRKARELAAKKGRKSVYRVMHVKNALSTSPSLVVLPNPFDPRYAGRFVVAEADARLRYRPTGDER